MSVSGRFGTVSSALESSFASVTATDSSPVLLRTTSPVTPIQSPASKSRTSANACAPSVSRDTSSWSLPV